MVPPVLTVRAPASTSASRFAAPAIRAGFAHQGNWILALVAGVVPRNLFRSLGGTETNDPGDSAGRWTRWKNCNGGIGRYAQAECWRCVLFPNGVGAQETGTPLWKEVLRFRSYRRARIALWHECADVDIAVWLSRLDRLREMRRTVS